jgi:hypothetical protein
MRDHESSPEYGSDAEKPELLLLAKKMFRVAEEAGRAIDDLSLRSLTGAIKTEDLVRASQMVRRIVFNRACDTLGLTDQQRQEVFENS